MICKLARGLQRIAPCSLLAPSTHVRASPDEHGVRSSLLRLAIRTGVAHLPSVIWGAQRSRRLSSRRTPRLPHLRVSRRRRVAGRSERGTPGLQVVRPSRRTRSEPPIHELVRPALALLVLTYLWDGQEIWLLVFRTNHWMSQRPPPRTGAVFGKQGRCDALPQHDSVRRVR